MARWDFDVRRNGGVEHWSWRRTEWDLSTKTSERLFDSFSECLNDAARHGCDSDAVVVVNADGRHPPTHH